MQDRMRHYLKMAGLGHVVVLLVALVGPCVATAFRPQRSVSIPVEFTVEQPLAHEDILGYHPKPVEEDEPEDIPETVSKPLKTVKPRTEKPPPKTVAKPKTTVERASTRVVRESPATPTTRKQLTNKEIQELLMRGAKPSVSTQIPDQEFLDYGLVRQVLYDAWIQPTREEGGGRGVEVEIRLRRDGVIVSFDLIRPSGNPVMDSSVMRALQAVPRIPGLSSAFLAKHDVVTIAFKLEDTAL